ncbi:DNA cytosine methyltransferase, partial [Klebsiella pneumoniae]|uniref:DNA cytosine methyltransferase n=1 Tax=Klebsiella pneumoniae TaxID=573 RepID=UPI002108BE1E
LRTPAGGSSRQIVVVVDGPLTRMRWLTPGEAARLMGVPEGYVLPRSASAGLKLMGDAVAVPVVRALAEGLLTPGAGRRAAA